MITKAALEKSLKKNLTTIEPIAKDANKKTEVTQIPNSKGGVDMKIKSETADLYMDTQFAAAIAAGVAESLASHLKLSQYDGTKMVITTPAFTALTTSGVWAQVAGTYIKSLGENFTISAAGRATYAGSYRRWFDLSCTLSGDSGFSAEYHFAFYKNGVILADSEQHRTISGINDVGSVTILDRVELNTNDYIEVWASVGASNPGGGVTADHLVMLIR
jgi:hypothetical protein